MSRPRVNQAVCAYCGTGNGTSLAPRRPSRDGRGVRIYVLPEDDQAKILAKVSAARGGVVSSP